jgi:hypothetical protein
MRMLRPIWKAAGLCIENPLQDENAVFSRSNVGPPEFPLSARGQRIDCGIPLGHFVRGPVGTLDDFHAAPRTGLP